jgi:flagellar biosynthesis repressor protein FlbT
MPLRFDLGPFEKLYVGKGVLSNSHERVYLAVEGKLPILQGKDVLQPNLASNYLEKLYCCMQKFYLEEAFAEHQSSYLALMLQALKEEPSFYSELKEVDTLVHGGVQYKALKTLKKLIRPSVFVVDKSEPQGSVRQVIPGSRLRFNLGQFEKLYIGKGVLSNSHERVYLAVEGKLPILQGKDVLQPNLASNYLEKLYCCIQKFYLEEAFAEHQSSYLALMLQALKEEPSFYSELKEVDTLVHGGEHYKALKALKKLIRPSVFVVDKSEPQGYVRRVMPGSRK